MCLGNLHVFVVGLHQFVLVCHKDSDVPQLNQKEQECQEGDDRVGRSVRTRVVRNERVYLFAIAEITPEDCGLQIDQCHHCHASQ